MAKAKGATIGGKPMTKKQQAASDAAKQSGKRRVRHVPTSEQSKAMADAAKTASAELKDTIETLEQSTRVDVSDRHQFGGRPKR